MLQEILEVEQMVGEEDTGLELTAENVEKSLDEIRSVEHEQLITVLSCRSTEQKM